MFDQTSWFILFGLVAIGLLAWFAVKLSDEAMSQSRYTIKDGSQGKTTSKFEDLFLLLRYPGWKKKR